MTTNPATPRPAATVILLRDLPDPSGRYTPLQVFVQRRVATMAFAAGMTVFPGGGVDDTDTGPAARAALGPSAARWARRLGCDPGPATGFVHAAVRETLEECGVRLRPELLHPWARWVTPEQEPRRYDAAFFVATLPAGQEAVDRTTETVSSGWRYPAAVLDEHAVGAARLMPPTWQSLTELTAFDDAAAVLAAASGRVVTPIRPVLVERGGRRVAVVGDREFPMP